MAFRDGPFENLKVAGPWVAGVAAIAAGVVALLLLLGDKSETLGRDGYRARGAFDTVVAPVSGVFAAPVRWFGQGADWLDDYWNAVEENRRLKAEVAELQAWRNAAVALKSVNQRYEALLNLRTEPAVPMITARAVSESRGPFKKARLLDAGSNKGVRIGNPVINEHGLVGRIVGATGGVSRMLLLTDVTAQTPVMVLRSDARAILSGDGGPNPKLMFLRGRDSVREGDQILTSGDGGVFPRGLPVGVAAKGLDGTWRVKLYSDRGAIQFVRILLFEDFSQLVRPDELTAPPLAAVGTAPPPDAPRPARPGPGVAVLPGTAQAPANLPAPQRLPDGAPVTTAARPATKAAAPTGPSASAPTPSAPRPSPAAAPPQPEPSAPEPAPAQPTPTGGGQP